MPRIVSLLPAATEIVCVLGARNELVGRSHECDWPRGVESLPALTRAKLPTADTSVVIHDRVTELVTRGLSIYEVDRAKLAELQPRVIITQAHCKVCAASLDEVEAAVAVALGHHEGNGSGPKPIVVATEPVDLGSVFNDVQRVASAIGRETAGERLLRTMHGRMDALARRAAKLPRVRVATLEWLDPLMTGGNWMPELIDMAGGADLFGTPGQHSPRLDLDELVAADPDVILIVPCGFGLEQTRRELSALKALPGFGELRALRTGRVVIADGNRYFNRPGPRLVESLEILAEILHPDAFLFGHEGDGWEVVAHSSET
ncbi:MAG: cobalamin-binding protein [Planctomycetota bacterium]